MESASRRIYTWPRTPALHARGQIWTQSFSTQNPYTQSHCTEPNFQNIYPSTFLSLPVSHTSCETYISPNHSVKISKVLTHVPSLIALFSYFINMIFNNNLKLNINGCMIQCFANCHLHFPDPLSKKYYPPKSGAFLSTQQTTPRAYTQPASLIPGRPINLQGKPLLVCRSAGLAVQSLLLNII